MPITETLMAPGSFTISLQADTPRYVREQVSLSAYPWSYVVVTDTRFAPGDVSAADLLSAASYTGVYRRSSGGGVELNGAGLCVLLGDEDGKGDLWMSADFALSTSRTFQNHVTAILLGNGITAGTIGADGSAAFQFKGDTGDSQRDWLDLLRVQKPGTDFEWRINPDGTLDSDTAANLWSSGNVVFSASPSGRDGSVIGLHAQLQVNGEDAESVARSSRVDWNDASNVQTAFSSAPLYTLAGSDLVTEAYLTNRPRRERPTGDSRAQYRAWASASAAEALKIAQSDIAERTNVKLELDVSHDEYAPSRFYSPGDTVYVYDLEQGIYDTTNSVQFRGETISPASARVLSHSRPVLEGYGVYHYRYNGAAMEFYDLSDHVEFETGSTSVEVGALHRALIN